jgi:aminopeptidase
MNWLTDDAHEGPLKGKKRCASLADLLVNYSTSVRQNEIVVIETFDVPKMMIEQLIDHVDRAGAHPVIWEKNWGTLRSFLKTASRQEIDEIALTELTQIKGADVYIGLRATLGFGELAGVPPEGLMLFQTRWLGPVHYRERVHNTRWCSCKWPTNSAAQAIGMSLSAYEELFFEACVGVDYLKMSRAMDPLVALMKATDEVRIVGPRTDVRFSMKGIPIRKCAGDRNVPDGEVLTAPMKDSVNGMITFNIPTAYQANQYTGVCLEFSDGRVVAAACDHGDKVALEGVFDTDAGARYVGEFAFGVNPQITRPLCDTMFDEKMAGSLHLALGNSYRDAYNGNQSSVHWDLVLNQTPQWGGGEIYFDSVLVSKDGVFKPPELVDLNPGEIVL